VRNAPLALVAPILFWLVSEPLMAGLASLFRQEKNQRGITDSTD